MCCLKKLSAVILAAGVFLAALGAPVPVIKLSLNKPSGIYAKGEKIEVNIGYFLNRKPASGPVSVSVIRQDGKKNTDIHETVPKQISFVADEAPFAWQIVVTPLKPDKKPFTSGKKKHPVEYSVGSICEPEKYTTGVAEPADFQKFWDDSLAELAKIPVKVLERKEMKLDDEMLKTAPNYFAFRIVAPMPSPEKLVGKFKSWEVKIACVNDVPVSGYLTMPAGAKPKSLPVIVSFLGAPGGSAHQAFADDVIRFDVNPHGFENGHPREYYKKMHATVTRHYQIRNSRNREKFYFRGMFLRAKRALDFVKTLPEYDGKTLIVVGNSQGGAQTLAAAGLDPDVKLIYASVPALCDHGAIFAKRRAGWPRLINLNKKGQPSPPEVAQVAPYYDCAFFAKRIKAEAYLTTGLVDNVCSPTSVFCAYNNIPGKKHITVFTHKGHSRTFSLTFNKRLLEVIKQVKDAQK